MSKTEIELRFARRMFERHIKCPIRFFQFGQRVVENRRAVLVTLFLPQPLENPLAIVPLLARDVAIIFKNLPDEREKRFDLFGLAGLLPLITRGLRMSENLF